MDAITPLVAAIGVFAATDIDDLLLVMAYFADPGIRRRDVVLGQFLGIGALVAASVLAAVGALFVPEGWTALLGVVPVAIGVQRWRKARRGENASDEDALPSTRARSEILAIAGVTIANGGDNLGVYIPLFASDPHRIPFFAAAFAVLTAVWCALAYWLVHHPTLGAAIRRHGQRALPFVLIGLGVYILLGARVLLGRA